MCVFHVCEQVQAEQKQSDWNRLQSCKRGELQPAASGAATAMRDSQLLRVLRVVNAGHPSPQQCMRIVSVFASHGREAKIDDAAPLPAFVQR